MGTGWTSSAWEEYWKTSGPPRDVVDSQEKWVQRINQFTSGRGIKPKSMADVGCGPGIMVMELAALHPDASFHGFDTAGGLVDSNAVRATELGLTNVGFETTTLPEVPAGFTFDLVLCIATLHYVEDSLQALRNLFSLVRSGGYLIFNYPNARTAKWYRANVSRADEIQRMRFALVLAGRNLLSRKEIEAALGQPCRNFWREVGESVDNANPCVFVSKPRVVKVGARSRQ